MSASKKYYLELQEQIYNELPDNEKLYLNHLGLQTKHIPTGEDLKDEKVLAFKKEIAKNYDSLDKYLFDKRSK